MDSNRSLNHHSLLLSMRRWLLSQHSPEDGALWPILTVEPGHPTRTAHFSLFYLGSPAFIYEPHLKAICENLTIEWPKIFNFWLMSQLLLFCDKPDQCLQYSINNEYISLFILPSFKSRLQDSWTPLLQRKKFTPIWREQSNVSGWEL